MLRDGLEDTVKDCFLSDENEWQRKEIAYSEVNTVESAFKEKQMTNESSR